MIKGTVRTSELNSFISIRVCGPWRVIRAQTWFAGVLILLSFPTVIYVVFVKQAKHIILSEV